MNNKALLYNKSNGINNYKTALECIEKAIEIKKTEKLFQQKESMLKFLNIHNADEIFEEHRNLVLKKIRDYEQEKIGEIKSKS